MEILFTQKRLLAQFDEGVSSATRK